MKCEHCGHYENMHYICQKCDRLVHGGEHFECPHGKPVPHDGFTPYFDHGLGKTIYTRGDRNRELRPKWENDYQVHLQPRDLPPSYYRDLAERRAERRARTLEGKDK